MVYHRVLHLEELGDGHQNKRLLRTDNYGNIGVIMTSIELQYARYVALDDGIGRSNLRTV